MRIKNVSNFISYHCSIILLLIFTSTSATAQAINTCDDVLENIERRTAEVAEQMQGFFAHVKSPTERKAQLGVISYIEAIRNEFGGAHALREADNLDRHNHTMRCLLKAADDPRYPEISRSSLKQHILIELASGAGESGAHEAALAYLDEIDKNATPDYSSPVIRAENQYALGMLDTAIADLEKGIARFEAAHGTGNLHLRKAHRMLKELRAKKKPN